jgi:hypothetical protein
MKKVELNKPSDYIFYFDFETFIDKSIDDYKDSDIPFIHTFEHQGELKKYLKFKENDAFVYGYLRKDKKIRRTKEL